MREIGRDIHSLSSFLPYDLGNSKPHDPLSAYFGFNKAEKDQVPKNDQT